MPASVVQTKTGAQNTGLATVTASWNTPATAGNLLLLVVGADDYAAAPPAGWTESTGCKQQTNLGHYLWWKIAVGGETSTTYTIGSASPSAWLTAEISGLTSTPYDVSNGQLAGSSGDTYTTPAIVPSTGARYLVASMGASAGSGTPALSLGTWLNSFTEQADSGSLPSGLSRDVVGIADRAVTGDGSTSFSSGATYSPSFNAQTRTGILIAFKVGSGSPDVTVALTGLAMTAAKGLLGVARDVPLVGQGVTAARGTLAPSTTRGLTGLGLTAAAGLLTPSGGSGPDVTVALTGLALTAGAGLLGVARSLALVGQGVTVAKGLLGPETARGLTGLALTAARGALVPSRAVPLTGLGLTAAAGVLTPSGGALTFNPAWATGSNVLIQRGEGLA